MDKDKIESNLGPGRYERDLENELAQQFLANSGQSKDFIANLSVKEISELILANRQVKKKLQKQQPVFKSKVSRDAQLSESASQKDFTGHAYFRDQQRNTISKAQDQLTLSTVKRMFAGRQEAH
jgi:molecular chaperone DnaK (HSP70)